MNLYIFVLYVFAVYFIAFTIARLDGPFDLMTFVRGRVDPQQKTWLGRGLNCPICLSFWIGAIVALIIGLWWLEWLAGCGLIILINKWVMR
jgi:hypothetical protein